MSPFTFLYSVYTGFLGIGGVCVCVRQPETLARSPCMVVRSLGKEWTIGKLSCERNAVRLAIVFSFSRYLRVCVGNLKRKMS